MIQISGDTLTVRPTRWAKVAALHGDVNVPLAAIRRVSVEPDGLVAARGVRAPGLAVPGHVKIGTWRGRGRRSFVLARRDVPAVRITLEGARFDELIVSTPDAEAVAGRLRAAAGL